VEYVSDGILMERIRNGDEEAFRTLLERRWPSLLSFAVGMVERRAVAEDLVQETFVQVWARRAEWSSGGSARAYLYRVTRNLALNAERDRRVRSRWEAEQRATTRSPPSALGDPARDLTSSTLRAEIDAAIQALPERRREVFVLSRFHGLSHREIAEAMGIAPQTVANQMRMALEHLRDHLRHHLDQR
jgi:RNA polymerase sigma-70 factor, ECF subfamily